MGFTCGAKISSKLSPLLGAANSASDFASRGRGESCVVKIFSQLATLWHLYVQCAPPVFLSGTMVCFIGVLRFLLTGDSPVTVRQKLVIARPSSTSLPRWSTIGIPTMLNFAHPSFSTLLNFSDQLGN